MLGAGFFMHLMCFLCFVWEHDQDDVRKREIDVDEIRVCCCLLPLYCLFVLPVRDDCH